MRLDKYLKVSRLVKRRTIAAEACDARRVFVNGIAAKPAKEIKIGDKIELRFGEKRHTFEVVSLSESIKKEDAVLMYRALN